MFMAAAAVSAGTIPELPRLRALEKRVVQLRDVDESELMHADRIFASVWILLRGIEPWDTVVPVATSAMLAASPISVAEYAVLGNG